MASGRNIIRMPSPNFWHGRNGQDAKWLILHGTAGGSSAQAIAAWFARPDAQVASHYIVGQDGTIVQCVDETDAAWANGGITGTPGTSGDQVHHDPWWIPGQNPNWVTISIEHVKSTTDNSAALTPAQQAASFWLIHDICLRNHIPMRPADEHGGITGHYSMDPINRSHCPGSYPWSDLWTFLGANIIPLNAHGEVVDMNEADQFQPNKTQFACGFYAVAMCRSMSTVDQAPTLSPTQITDDAEQWYAQYDGDNSISNVDGMTVDQLHQLLAQVGLHFQASPNSIDYVRAWVKLGVPVIISVPEATIFDLDLGRNPYPWTPAGNHIFVVTGVMENGNLVVRDSANCTDLNDPHSLRPGPRHYRADLGLVSVTAVIPPWRQQPPAGFNPITGVLPMPVPTNWKDDGSTLTAPNGHKVVQGFRIHILNAPSWNALNQPLQDEEALPHVEESNTSLGSGSRQIFEMTSLEWTESHGVFEGWIGQEFLFVKAERDRKAAELARAQADLAAAQQKVVQLQLAELQAQHLTQPAVPNTAAIKAALLAASQLLKPYSDIEGEISQALSQLS